MKCLICQENNLTRFMVRRDKLEFFKCQICHLIQSKRTYQVNYDEKYFDKESSETIGYQEYSRQPLFELYWQVALIKLLGGVQNQKVLDIGCATGKFLELAENEGFSARGIDISEYAYTICKKKGFEVRLANIERVRNIHKNYEFICAWELIEHLSNPLFAIKKIMKWLPKNGIFIFSTPNVTDKKPDWNGFQISNEHFIYFAEKTLKYLFKKVNPQFNLELINFSSDNSDTLIGIVYKNKGSLNKYRNIIQALKFKSYVSNKKYNTYLASIYSNFNQKEALEEYFKRYNSVISPIKISYAYKNPNFYEILDTLNNNSKTWLSKSYLWPYLNSLKELQRENLKNLLTKSQSEIENLKKEKTKVSRDLYVSEQRLQAIFNSRIWYFLGFYKRVIALYKKFTNLYLTNRKLVIRDPNVSLIKKMTYLFFPFKPIYFEAGNYRFYDVLIFSIISWTHKKQRPQHLAYQFAKNNHRVFYIENSFIKAPRRNLSRKELESLVEVTRVSQNTYVVKLVCFNDLFIYQDTISDEIDLTYLKWSIEYILNNARIQKFIMKIDAPFWYQLAREFPSSIIYDCLDKHSGFWTHTENISDIEDELAKNSNLVLASSSSLYRNMKKLNQNVVLVQNACEFAHFNKKTETIPEELQMLKRPIIGYFGAISDWLDYKLVDYIAQKKRDISLVFIGNYDSRARINILKRIKNVYYLGEQKYVDLPNWIHNFDVTILPFKITSLTLATNPVKMYEIFATGKPLVSVNLPEIQRVKNLCYIANSQKEFVKKIDQALKENNPIIQKERIKFASLNTWEERYKIIEESIKRHIYPKVSVIMVSFNTYAFTISTIESVIKYSNWPNLEIIVVDNNSSDLSPKYFYKAQKLYPQLQVIYNSTNLGFATANNIGLKNATGEYIILLNSDTIVTNNWIENLIKHLKNAKIGLVGPVTNLIGNEAKIDLKYKSTAEMQEKVRKYVEKHQGSFFEIDNLAFFCVAGKKSLFDEIGPLDERFKFGFFEDDDYCIRVKKKGYKLICAEDVFIHHVGHATLNKMPQFSKIFNINRIKFEKKWGHRWLPHTYRKL